MSTNPPNPNSLPPTSGNSAKSWFTASKRTLSRTIGAVFHWKHPGVLVAIFVAVGFAMAGIGQNAHSAGLVNLGFALAYVAFALAAIWSIGSYRVSAFLERKNPMRNPWDDLSISAFRWWEWGGYSGITVLFLVMMVVTVLFHRDKLSSIPNAPIPVVESKASAPKPVKTATPAPTETPSQGDEEIDTRFGELRGDVGIATGQLGMEFDGCSKAKCITEEGIASKSVVIDFNGKNSARIAVLLSTFPGPNGYSWDTSQYNNVKVSTSKEVSVDYAGRKREPPQSTLLFTLDDMYITTKAHDPEGFMVDITPHSKTPTIPLTIVAWANAMRRHTVTTTLVVKNFGARAVESTQTPPPRAPRVGLGQAELTRRKQLLERLKSEYILSHDGISPALAAGTEQPPVEWTNKRLKELGEAWNLPSPTPAPTERVDWHDKQNWRQLLRIGMTKEEVRKLFGDAESVSVFGNYESWEYGRGSVQFSKDVVSGWHEP